MIPRAEVLQDVTSASPQQVLFGQSSSFSAILSKLRRRDAQSKGQGRDGRVVRH
eukprot:m.118599 g.118599  ORF g.118599 m.118599 type:complete len:54 (+) comp15569_c0_seq6:1464-1625(+)